MRINSPTGTGMREKSPPRAFVGVGMGIFSPLRCKENGPRAIWLIEFWCLMNNTIHDLISFLVFVFVVHRMQDLLGLWN
jgi:hypothetical protein